MIGVWIGEVRIKVHLFVMVLGFSRRIFVRAYEHERLSNLLDGHQAAFEHFGGRTSRLLYDNPSNDRADQGRGQDFAVPFLAIFEHSKWADLVDTNPLDLHPNPWVLDARHRVKHPVPLETFQPLQINANAPFRRSTTRSR